MYMHVHVHVSVCVLQCIAINLVVEVKVVDMVVMEDKSEQLTPRIHIH